VSDTDQYPCQIARIDAYVSPPLVVAVECEGHGSKIPLEASMSYISSEEIQNYYLFEVQLSNDAYLKHEKERRKPSIIEVDQNLCKKPSQSEIDLKRTPPDFINLTADEKFDDYSRLSSSVCAISESKQSATASDQAEVHLYTRYVCTNFAYKHCMFCVIALCWFELRPDAQTRPQSAQERV
jgi:hypothetical protein